MNEKECKEFADSNPEYTWRGVEKSTKSSPANCFYYKGNLDSKGDSMPYRYCFVLTNACNLRCSFCFQEKKPIKGSLKLDNWIDVASQLPYGSHITLTGGEPLMFRGFKKLVENLRDDRNSRLAATDFYALSDVTMSPEMETYRQELRDITNGLTTVEQVEAVVFPTKP